MVTPVRADLLLKQCVDFEIITSLLSSLTTTLDPDLYYLGLKAVSKFIRIKGSIEGIHSKTTHFQGVLSLILGYPHRTTCLPTHVI
ncbi:hypothetical protein ES332_A13G134000v1 [Gossypium tomentosum]|uniref:Uncharacterized protein n=1 Tax=Gossypium tomentosum TaxID=34277 RepID=A0A5D2MK40_GOSTO|nr:hypothetical protein ES332_A13G134000v1 [Gossypium tomentosum]